MDYSVSCLSCTSVERYCCASECAFPSSRCFPSDIPTVTVTQGVALPGPSCGCHSCERHVQLLYSCARLCARMFPLWEWKFLLVFSDQDALGTACPSHTQQASPVQEDIHSQDGNTISLSERSKSALLILTRIYI